MRDRQIQYEQFCLSFEQDFSSILCTKVILAKVNLTISFIVEFQIRYIHYLDAIQWDRYPILKYLIHPSYVSAHALWYSKTF